MNDEEFWRLLHKNAVNFRNKKRKEYLNGTLNPEYEWMVERWDCEPNHDLQEEMKKRGIEISKKMFISKLSEEPLSIDVKLKWREKNDL